MPKQSAGILLFRNKASLEVLLVHPGGPFFVKKDLGNWTIPKGEYEDEDPLAAARREFQEETGFSPEGEFLPLDTIKQKSGKIVQAWAVAGDLDADAIVSNTFEITWPPKSSQIKTFPEVDRAGWFSMDEARQKINPAQVAFLDRLETLLF